MEYIIIALLLFSLILVYFTIADKFNIIDKPNHRSAHTEITLRGGGIIYPISFLLFLGSKYYFDNGFIFQKYNYLLFGLGFLTICTISFLDDILDLSSKVRLVFHFISVSLLLLFLHVFQFPFWVVPIAYVFIIGILNAYNFMDGINGMSGLYSLVTLVTLFYINKFYIQFIDDNFILYPILATVVFLFFNFRKKARCFMGDIGSLGIAFWIVALIGLLMIRTGELKWILLLSVYGTEVVLTIIERLKLKENIFEAHRRHLYQLFVNEKKKSHLLVSIGYSFIQLLINMFLVKTQFNVFITALLILIPLSIIYLIMKSKIKKEILNETT